GTVAHRGPVATFEITIWLRGPRLVSRPFSVTTSSGELPAAGAEVLSHPPAATIPLAIGSTGASPSCGKPRTVAPRPAGAAGGPFRSADVGIVEMIAPIGSKPAAFAHVALVVWRPAVAYLAIVMAATLPGLVLLWT